MAGMIQLKNDLILNEGKYLPDEISHVVQVQDESGEWTTRSEASPKRIPTGSDAETLVADTVFALKMVVAAYYSYVDDDRLRRVKITVGQSGHEFAVDASKIFTSINGFASTVLDEVNEVRSFFRNVADPLSRYERELDKME
jgi:hypothetical protein